MEWREEQKRKFHEGERISVLLRQFSVVMVCCAHLWAMILYENQIRCISIVPISVCFIDVSINGSVMMLFCLFVV